MIAFTDADIGRAEFPAVFGAFGSSVFNKSNHLFANRAEYFVLFLTGFIREALLLGHRYTSPLQQDSRLRFH